MRVSCVTAGALLATFLLCGSAFAGEGEWIVRKASGEVWTGQAAQPVSLSKDAVLKPGDTVTTGRNGRVLLVRGEESILISPNSVIGIPAEKKDGLATTITQQAGSILLEVEKKNVPHFEVETPYLAAVVKGTQFRVSVTDTGARVDVTRGKVEVADFRSGDVAQVLPGQAAETHAGSHGLHMSGSGDFLPIQRGTPRNSTITPIMVPRGGLKSPQGVDHNRTRDAMRTQQMKSGNEARVTTAHRANVVRISAPLGEVRLNFHKVTHGLARDTGKAGDSGRRLAGRDATIWSADNGASSLVSANTSSNGGGNGGVSGGSASGATPSAATAPGATKPNGNGKGVGNGNSQSASNNNGNGNGNNGNGNNGNGNGNGNGGQGNGKGNGNSKH